MVNPVFGADGDNPLHIWSARLCKFLSGLRTAKMDGNLFAKRIQRVAPAARDNNGQRLSDHLHEIAANSEL